MLATKGIFDGEVVRLTEKIHRPKGSPAIVVFPDEGREETISPALAREQLRGSGRGERLVEKLLKSRREDLHLER